MEITFSSAPGITPRVDIKHDGLQLTIDPTRLRPDGIGGLRRVIDHTITEGLITTARELYNYQGFTDIDFVMMVANAFIADWELEDFVRKAGELKESREKRLSEKA